MAPSLFRRGNIGALNGENHKGKEHVMKHGCLLVLIVFSCFMFGGIIITLLAVALEVIQIFFPLIIAVVLILLIVWLLKQLGLINDSPKKKQKRPRYHR